MVITRKLTVQSTTVLGARLLMYERPSLSLTGKWLADAGFPARTPITVTVEQGRLIIERQDGTKGEQA
jgi:hypothetical protein